MQKEPSSGILHDCTRIIIKNSKFAIKNMKFSINNMKFSIYEVRQNSSFVLFVTEFSYHMYRKNAVLNGKQKQMKPLHVTYGIF